MTTARDKMLISEIFYCLSHFSLLVYKSVAFLFWKISLEEYNTAGVVFCFTL